MEVTYELTQRDFFDALVAHRMRSWVFRLAALIALVLVGAGLIVVGTHPYLWPTWQPVFWLVGLWATLSFATPWWASRKQFLHQPGAQGPRTISVDDAGVQWKWGSGSASVEWKNFVRVAESKSQFLLYSSPVSFSVLPKRALTPAEMAEFRELLGKHPPPTR